MEMGKTILLIVLMIYVSASLPMISRGRQLADSRSLNSLEGMVEQMWLNCRLDPMDVKAAIKGLDSSILKGFISDSTELDLKRKMFVNEGTREAFTPPSPEIKHTLLDCLSKQSFLLRVSGEDSPRNRFAEYMASLLGGDTVSRRHLADQPNRIMPPTLAPAPVLASAPFLGPGVEPPSSPSPSSDPAPGGPSPASVPNGVFPLESDGPSGNEAAVVPPEKHDNSKRSVVIAVVVTVAGMSILAVLFFCCNRCLRKNYDAENGQKDERPLLTLSMSDFSGSSHQSAGLGGSIQKDKIGSLSFKTESSLNGYVVTLDGSRETPASEVLSGIPTSSTEPSNASSSAIAPMPPPLPPLKPPPGRKVASPPPAPPPPLPKPKPSPPPPPPPKAAATRPPQPSPSSSKVPRPSPLGPNRSGDKDFDANAPKAKLKPLFWDKVSTNPEKSMVWNEIKSGSFQFDEDMIETLFGYRSNDKQKSEGKKGSLSNDSSSQYIQLLDPKKSQNLAISLKALSVKIDEVCDALMEGNELPAELLQTLLRMAPTTDEELKLRLYNDDPLLLGPGERFLKAMINIPFAFKRMDALLFMTSLKEDLSSIKESFASLEVACKELRSSRLFLKLLEAVLKLGNRMNDGTFRGGAQAFKLDTLLKLSDVKGADGKTTLLHFVVQEIIRSEGVRAVRMARESRSNSSLTTSSLASDDQSDYSFQDSEDHYRNLGLKVVSGLSTELENVKKAAGLDADALTSAVASLGHKLVKTKEFLNTDMKSVEEESGFHQSLKFFVEHAEVDITLLLEEEKRMRSVVKSTTDYFHGNSGKDEGLRLFVIVRDLLGMLDKACKEVRESQKKVVKMPGSRDNLTLAPIQEPRQLLFPAIRDRRVDSSSSDDEGS